MLCPSCHSPDVHRSRRQGVLDALRSWSGYWPYRCFDCGRRAFYRGRRLSTAAFKAAKPAKGSKAGVLISADKPTAQIVIQAETQAQLDHVLLALSRAVSSYNPVSHPHPQGENLKAHSTR
jgi:hypothetical protein